MQNAECKRQKSSASCLPFCILPSAFCIPGSIQRPVRFSALAKRAEFGDPSQLFIRGKTMAEIMKLVESREARTDIPNFDPGDTIKVHVKVKEGDKERI